MLKRIAFVFTVLLLIARVSFSAPGDLDPTFGGDGIVTYSGLGSAVAIQSDGKIVATGGTYDGAHYHVLVIRYNSDGTLDNTFGENGVVIYRGAGGDDMGKGVAIQPDGKIIVVGYSYDGPNTSDPSRVIVLRYNTDGTLDTTFGGGDGIAMYGPVVRWDSGFAVAIQTDGKVVVAGQSYKGPGVYELLVLRYQDDGTPDPTFGGGDGVVTYDSGSGWDYGSSVAIQSEGKIVVVGGKWAGSNYDVLVLRYNNNGTLDNTFGAGGVTTYNHGGYDYERAVAIQPDGKIVVVGTSDNNDVLVLRYNTDGTLDTTFGGGDGIVTYDGGGGGVGDSGRSVAIQPDGKIVITGQSVIGSTIDLLILRYNSDGTLDTTFGGGDGVVTYDGPAHGSDYGASVAIWPEGKIIVTGSSESSILTMRLIAIVSPPDPAVLISPSLMTTITSKPLSFTTPGTATLISPSGTIFTNIPTYTWNAVSNSTWYRLWVNDSTGNKIQQWYRAADAGCPDGTGSCSVTPGTALAAGLCQWWIQTYGSVGYGPWSAGMNFTVSPPEAATLVFPSGDITDTTPTYTWNAVPYSTWYRLWVNDSTSNKIQQWYKASDVGCALGTGTCSVTPTTEAVGSCQWWVQTYSSVGFGPWSDPLSFTTPIPPPPPAATQVSPTGETPDNTPTYRWNPVSNSTWYCLYVNDSTGNNKINQWYAAADAGCPDGKGTCSATPSVALAPGVSKWWIQTYNSGGYGDWSSGMSFIILAQSLYDDFSGASINKDKWGQGELVREIQGGELVSKATAYGSRMINNLDFKNPASITSIEADVMIDKIEGDYDPADTAKYSLPNARLTGFFYNDGTASGPGSHKGEVQGILRMILSRGKLSVQWAVEKSLDDEATSWMSLGSGIFSDPISLNIPYGLSIQFEPGLKKFTFKLGTSISTWTSTDAINPSNTPWKAIGTEVSFFPTTPSPYYGKVSATFDHVIAKDQSGSVLVSDDFSSSSLDSTKWATYELVREISGGKLRSKVRSSSATTSPVYNDLDFLYPSSIDFIQTKVSPVTYQNSLGANAVARLAGYYYNDGTGTGVPQDHTGDVGAEVWLGGTGVNPVASWVVFRSTDSAGEVPATVVSGTFTTPISLGNTYTLALGWDGSRFTFKVNDEEATYTPATTIKPPNCPWKAIGTRIWEPAGKEATIEALFDDVSLYSSPPVAATLVSPSATINDATPTYIWNAVSDATWYQLYVNDPTGNKIQKWYTALEAGCISGTGTCSVTPTTGVGGSCQWWVQTYNLAGLGPWSASLTFTVPIPEKATLVSPSGEINDTTPTYTWNADPRATWYRLWVNEATVNKIQKWYTASEVGCASGTGTCSVTPTTEVGGSCQWWVQTYNPAGFGPWSTPMSFTAPRPDLIETSVTNPPQTSKVGTTFSVTDTVKNQGNVNAGPSVTQYYLSVDSLRGSGDILLGGTRSVPSLAVGATSMNTVSVTIFSGTAPGIYYLLACADDKNVVAESDETNNCIASTSTVQVTAPDLIETSVTNPPQIAKVGTTFSVTDTVKNQGNVNAGPSVTQYYLSVDSVRGSGDILLEGGRYVTGLAPGETLSGTTILKIPSNTAPQAYYLLACADDMKAVAESNETNNCIASSSKVQVIP